VKLEGGRCFAVLCCVCGWLAFTTNHTQAPTTKPTPTTTNTHHNQPPAQPPPPPPPPHTHTLTPPRPGVWPRLPHQGRPQDGQVTRQHTRPGRPGRRLRPRCGALLLHAARAIWVRGGLWVVRGGGTEGWDLNVSCAPCEDCNQLSPAPLAIITTSTWSFPTTSMPPCPNNLHPPPTHTHARPKQPRRQLQ